MEDLFGQIECRSRSDSIVMKILRSAMDKTHEKLQFKDGPIEFLHERTIFYKLAAILVEGGLNIVQEETHILEGGCNEILSDLMEIRQWLEGRIQDMKQLIIDKDRELTERLENEAKLRQALDQKDRELVYLHEKIEPGRMKNDDVHDLPISNDEIHDGATDGDIFRLKSSVDQQVLNIKQKLEDEKKILTSERRTRRSLVSSPNLSFLLDKERTGSLVLKEDESFGIDKFDNIKPQNELSRLNQNVLIKGMSSDIDILKGTLDLAFGRMQSAEVLPLEKQWRWTIEKHTESILVRGFISDLKRSFDVEVKKKVRVLKDNWFEFMDEMRTLFYELKDFFAENDRADGKGLRSNPFPGVSRTTSEPFLDFTCTENQIEDDNGSHIVAKMIKNHESIICKQREQDYKWLTRERCSTVKKEKESSRQERRIQNAITRLDNFMKRNHEFADQTCLSYIPKRRITNNNMKTIRSLETVERSRVEIVKQEEREGLCLQISMMEEIYQLLLQGMMKDVSTGFCCKDNERLMKDYSDGLPTRKECDAPDDELEGSTSTQIQLHYLESTIREDIYMVFFRELAESWKSEMAASAMEGFIREDVYQFVVIEAVKDTNLHSLESSRLLRQTSFQERTPRSRRLQHGDNSQQATPRSRKLETDGDESLIEKLDSLLKSLEAEEDLMLKASCIIKEHNVNNSLVILNCEEVDERDAIEWLITDDEITFNSVSEKLERALQQLCTSKELLVELEQTLEVSDDFGEYYDQQEQLNTNYIEHENSNGDQGGLTAASDNLLAIIMQFQKLFNNVEHLLLENLESKSLRVEVLKRQVDKLTQPVSLIRTRKLLYRKAFISRCHNLRLAETEVDLLGDQVESLLYLLERIYVVLNRNATVLSGHFEVEDILKLIKLELNNERSCLVKHKS